MKKKITGSNNFSQDFFSQPWIVDHLWEFFVNDNALFWFIIVLIITMLIEYRYSSGILNFIFQLIVFI